MLTGLYSSTINTCYWQSGCSKKCPSRFFCDRRVFLFEATCGDRGFSMFFAITSSSNSHDNMLTGVCYSTIKTVTASEFVQKNCPSRFLSDRGNCFRSDFCWTTC